MSHSGPWPCLGMLGHCSRVQVLPACDGWGTGASRRGPGCYPQRQVYTWGMSVVTVVSPAPRTGVGTRRSVNVERAGSGTYTTLGKYSHVISDGFVEFPSLRLSEWPLPVSWVVWSSGQVLDRSGLGSAAGAVYLWASSLASLRFYSLSH